MEKIFIIDHKQLKFDKNAGWNLIGIPDKPDVTFSDNDTFCIHDDIFDIIQSTHQDRNIMWGLPQEMYILMSLFNSIKYIIMYAKIIMIRQSYIFFLRYSD